MGPRQDANALRRVRNWAPALLIAGLLLCFALIAQEVLEGEPIAFDRWVMQGYLNLKGYYEFAAENRPSGFNTWVTFAISPAEKPAPSPLARVAIHK